MGILRTRMEQDLVVRGRSVHTCRAYLRVITDLARYHHRSPDQLSDREVQQYLLYLIEERHLAWASCRQAAGALRFFYEVTLGRKRRSGARRGNHRCRPESPSRPGRASRAFPLRPGARPDAGRPVTTCRSAPVIETPPGAAPFPAPLSERLAAAVAARGPGWRPRTRHQEAGRPRFVNRLALETSPYLQQHAHNPVNWYPWGDEAFEEARRTGRPVFLSVGYSTCHWCYVMERRVVRGRGDRARPERAVRRHQGGPGGAAGY